MERLNRRRIVNEVKEMETRIETVRDEKMRQILDLLPSGITLHQVKYAFVDKVINACKGNLSAAAREMAVPYRTLVCWVHETDKITAEARGREKAGMANAKFRKKKALQD